MDNYYDAYQRRMSIRGRSPYERNLKHKTRTFNNYFNNSLNKEMVVVNQTQEMPMVFQDHSQSNNKDLSDDKYVIAKNENPIRVGDYIRWRDSMWMIFTKETKTIPTHQQAKVKEVNELVRWIRNGKIINDGIGWWAYVKSNTLYTMGVSETPYIHVPDAKMMMFLQNNEDTKSLQMNERVFVGTNVYKIKFIDDVSRNGLISFLLDQDTINPNYDNVELGVADYYKYFGKGIDFAHESNEEDEVVSANISGSETIKVGSINKYTSEVPIKEWSINSMDSEDKIDVIYTDDYNIEIRCKNDFKAIGGKFSILAMDEDDNYHSFSVSIVKKY